MRYFVHDTPRHVRQDSVGMSNEERMAYSAAHSTSMFFRQNTMFFLLHIFKHSKMDGHSFWNFQSKGPGDVCRLFNGFIDILDISLLPPGILVPGGTRQIVQAAKGREFLCGCAWNTTNSRTGFAFKIRMFLAAPPPKKIYIYIYSLDPPPKKNDLVDVAKMMFFFFFFSFDIKRCWALTKPSPCLESRDPLSGEPTKSFRNIGKLRRDLTFVRVSQENMGRNWGVLLGTKWGYIQF